MRLVNLNTAKTLQELGYDGEATKWYARNGSIKSTNLVDDDIPAPRLDDAAYWLRDKHHICIEIGVIIAKCWVAYIYNYGKDVKELFFEIYGDYDDALEASVIKALGIIKNKQDDGSD